MNERDRELALQAWTENDWEGYLNIKKLIAIIRADAMEAATRAANESWTLACKKMVEFEREACAKVCDELHWPWHMGDNSGPKECAEAIRARENK